MEVRVHARNTSLSNGFRAEVQDKIGHASRFFNHTGDVDVEFSEEVNPRRHAERFRMELTALAAGHTLRVESRAGSPEAALDLGVKRFNRQLKRLKGRLIERGRKGGPPGRESDTGDGGRISREIVRVKQFVMKPMTVEEAALQMETLGHAFYFFLAAESGRQAVLYRRKDGRLGLIESA